MDQDVDGCALGLAVGVVHFFREQDELHLGLLVGVEALSDCPEKEERVDEVFVFEHLLVVVDHFVCVWEVHLDFWLDFVRGICLFFGR